MNRRDFLKSGALSLGATATLPFKLSAEDLRSKLWKDIYKKYVTEDMPTVIKGRFERFASEIYTALEFLKKDISSESLEKILIGELPDSLWGTAIGEGKYAISGLETNGYKRLGAAPDPNTDLKISQATTLTTNDGEKGWYYVDNLTDNIDTGAIEGASPGNPTYITIKNKGIVGVALPELIHTAGGSRRQDITLSINVIPVELASFTAANVKNDLDDIILNWTTLTETNNHRFYIERSKDEKNWEEIGFVKGNATTSNENKYNFRDQDLDVGNYFYRLKQVDFDGTHEYSPVINASVKAPENFSLDQNFPNPFNPKTTIGYSLPKDTKVNLTVYNILGQEVKTLINKEQQAGIYSVLFNGKDSYGRDIPSGIYFYKIQAGKFTKVERMTLLK